MMELPLLILGFVVFKIMVSIGLRIESINKLVCLRLSFGTEDGVLEFDLASKDDEEKNFRVRHEATFDASCIEEMQAFIDAVRPLIKI